MEHELENFIQQDNEVDEQILLLQLNIWLIWLIDEIEEELILRKLL